LVRLHPAALTARPARLALSHQVILADRPGQLGPASPATPQVRWDRLGPDKYMAGAGTEENTLKPHRFCRYQAKGCRDILFFF